MDGNEFLDPFVRLLEDIASPEAIRKVETGGSIGAMWGALQESGFLDALVPESAGGVGLALADVAPLLQALGHQAVPVPVGETMIARALLAEAGVEAPAGPIVLATIADGRAAAAPFALVAGHALVDTGRTFILAPLGDEVRTATGVPHSLAAHLAWNGVPEGPSFAAPEGGLRPIAALVRATAIAGATGRLLDMTVAYANERVQFGKPIGKQQALQQQLAVMAEQTVAARIAAQIGCAGGLPPTLAAAATAKHITSSVAAEVANVAHAVHGAIGVSEEYDLQIYSRRLHEWRLADGSESYWAALLGHVRLTSAPCSSVDFIRERIEGPGAAA